MISKRRKQEQRILSIKPHPRSPPFEAFALPLAPDKGVFEVREIAVLGLEEDPSFDQVLGVVETFGRTTFRISLVRLLVLADSAAARQTRQSATINLLERNRCQ